MINNTPLNNEINEDATKKVASRDLAAKTGALEEKREMSETVKKSLEERIRKDMAKREQKRREFVGKTALEIMKQAENEELNNTPIQKNHLPEFANVASKTAQLEEGAQKAENNQNPEEGVEGQRNNNEAQQESEQGNTPAQNPRNQQAIQRNKDEEEQENNQNTQNSGGKSSIMGKIGKAALITGGIGGTLGFLIS